ncbi:S1 family peptidase [Fuerstiella marisgermanici]|uniref:Trypsin-like peptidase domain-containing protein n=1 Tax=Fuerstiella marisgermanici TaxID=1891926 RepID=A0A1P8WGP3_9PLAN|nr:serine protease [Fuerstiella marisgermanici]APZ93212.1 hypothetical protein Fuma_02829 [Fuerstiella marisgermanici]
MSSLLESQLRSATCLVACGGESATAWLVSHNRVLTARHSIIPAIEKDVPIRLTFYAVAASDQEQVCEATLVAEHSELDTALLSFAASIDRKELPIQDSVPREGKTWLTFGFPTGKTMIGHRLTGTIATTLPEPRCGIDLDLTVSPEARLDSYKGLSGSAVIVDDFVVGLLRITVNGTVAAISLCQLSGFLQCYEVLETESDESSDAQAYLPDWDGFQNSLEERILRSSTRYLFIEGNPGGGKSTFCDQFVPNAEEIAHVGSYCLREP